VKPSQRSVNRILINVVLDGALAAVAAPLARWIADPGGGLLHPLWFLGSGGITLLLGGLPFRLSQQYWRFSGLSDLIGVMASSAACAALFALLLVVTGFHLPTITFPIVHALTLMVLLGTPRLSYRLYRGRPRRATDDAALHRVVLVGAGDAADAFIRATAADPATGLRIVGLLALADRQAGRRMHGLPILGTAAQAGEVLQALAHRKRLPSALVITEPDFLGAPLAALIAAAEAAGIPVRRAPRPTALTAAERIELRPVAIEDLLNRPQVTLDRPGMARLIAGRRVLVTGAGGTIGAELARQLAALHPARLVLLDQSEYALWQIDIELSEVAPSVTRRAIIADVRDRRRIEAVFAAERPDIVFHAAALKHVPMVEANPLEGLLTNAAGTRIVADAARTAGTAAMVLISTDKAVNPTSLMGTSKRVAEMYCQALDIEARAHGAGMRCVTVRFGNVLGSTGSVVPLFRRQLERGGPLTVTHPEMQRYFMTVREAVSLVLQASVVGLEHAAFPAHEEGGIFVLDMGKPVRIVDLARQMIRLAGLRPEIDVGIVYTGLRPGEKLFEELFHGREPPVPTGHPGLLIAAPRTSDAASVARAIDALAESCRAGDFDRALGLVIGLVPEFRPDRPPVPQAGHAAGVFAAEPVAAAR
jgi:O-antigen biosynthesis protein WbqV